MRYLFLAVMFACVSMHASAMVVEPQKKSEHSKLVHHTSNNAPAKVVLAPASKASIGFSEAALNANYDMMELYLQQGADINCRNCAVKGQAPMFRALSTNQLELAEWLIQHGANANTPEFNSGQTSLMNAAVHVELTKIDILLKHGANVSAKDNEGCQTASNTFH